MKWEGRRRSDNIEDRRGMRISRGGGGIGLIILALIGAYFGIDPRLIMGVGGQFMGGTEQVQTEYQASPQEQQLANFVSVVLADTEDAWNQIFRENGGSYQEPKLVLFSGTVSSACGTAESAMGPFYCPGDSRVYIDLSFYDDLRKRHNAPGDFAQAYVIAHEVGHHVQHLLGISDKVHEMSSKSDEKKANQMSVRLELQADCLAGVWGNRTERVKKVLEQGDIDEALRAASAIGDDRLQKQATGRVVPDSFTHGTSEQRVRWFKRGMQSGRMSDCDTFKAASL